MHRVVVGVSGSPGSLYALHRAAAEARVRDAELWVVITWQEPGGELGSRNSCNASALTACRAVAVERLREVLDAAFGAAEPGVTLAGLTVRATLGAALVDTARRPEDLLVVGTGSRTPLRRLVRPSVARYCLAHATSPS
ncbi:universal stress protein [Streptomyces sp. NPDC058622]|uniref:universal stress protein n=1 Tax=Streptomyces sp. NPDC058622 TaxID=3346562 RepID=UPI0036664F4D